MDYCGEMSTRINTNNAPLIAEAKREIKIKFKI